MVDVFSGNTRPSRRFRTPRLPFSGPKPVRWFLLPSWPFLRRKRPVSTRSLFGSSCADCGSPCASACALLPVWPSPRSTWRPYSVRKCKGFGATRLGAGECCSPCLLGSWGPRENQPCCAGHGLGCLQPVGWTSSGDRGRRASLVGQVSAGSRHNHGVTHSRDGGRSEGLGNHQREGPVLERTYPELTGELGRARLVVLGVEVGGRWSAEASVFLRCLAEAKGRRAPPWLAGRVHAAWLRRWQGLQGCARAFSCSLLDFASPAGDGATPSMSAVLGEARYT